jgi:hypothetical protein
MDAVKQIKGRLSGNNVQKLCIGHSTSQEFQPSFAVQLCRLHGKSAAKAFA